MLTMHIIIVTVMHMHVDMHVDMHIVTCICMLTCVYECTHVYIVIDILTQITPHRVRAHVCKR